MAQRNIDQIVSGDLFTQTKPGDVPPPGPPVGQQRFLREDGTWQPGSGVTGSVFTTVLDGLVPHPGSVNQFVLRDDATWVAQPVIPGVFTTGANGLVPASGSVAGKFLGDNSAFNAPPTFATTSNGYVPSPGSVTGKVLSDSGAWITVPGAGGSPNDWFNVKTGYSAVGDGVHDDTTNIQNAITAAINNGGGTVYFPVGNYKTTASLTVPGASLAGIRLLGANASPGGSNAQGAVIIGSVSDYLLKTTHNPNNTDNFPISGIECIAFVNTFARTTNIADTDSAGGGVYIGGGIGFSMRYCQIATSGGIGFFSTGQNLCITNTNFVGGFSGTHAPRDIGCMIQNGKIENCKFQSNGTAIIGVVNGTGVIICDNIDIEISDTGICAGFAPIQFWDFVRRALQPTGNYVIGGRINNVNVESTGNTDGAAGSLSSVAYLVVANFTVSNCAWAQFGAVGTPKYGLNIQSANNCNFTNLGINTGATGYSVAAVNTFNIIGCNFIDVNANAQGGGGVAWSTSQGGTGNATVQSAGADGNYWNYSTTDGGMNINNNAASGNFFPLAPTAFGQTMVCLDCQDPVWTGTVSNAGKPESAAATTNASSAGNTSVIHFPANATFFNFIANGWQVFNLSDPNLSLSANTTIQSFNAGAGTVTVTPVIINGGNGVGNGAIIAFTNGGGTNKVLLRWTGTAAGNNGAWRIAG